MSSSKKPQKDLTLAMWGSVESSEEEDEEEEHFRGNISRR